MKLKYYALLLSSFAIINISILILSSRKINLTKISISRIGSLEGNYLFFFISTSILVIMFSLFLYKSYKHLGYKPRNEIYLISILSIIGLVFKVGEVFDFERIMHNILFIISGCLALFIIFDLNKKYLEKKIKTTKGLNTLPKIAFLGTIAVFLLMGLNVITELIYLGAVLSWVNVISFSS